MNMSHFRTLEAVISQVRIPFRPKHDPSKRLAEEIESCKRKIWECVDPAEREQYLEKKQKKHTKQDGIVESSNESSQHSSNNNSRPLSAFKKPEGQHQLPAIKKAQKTRSQPPKQPTQTRSDIELKVLVMKVVELKKELKARGGDTSGLKKDLRSRLMSIMLEQLDQEEQSVPSVTNKTTGISNSITAVESIVEHKENSNTMEISKNRNIPASNNGSKLEDKRVPPPLENSSDQENRGKESISSMQVEHHSTEVEPVKTTEPEQKEMEQNEMEQDKTESICSSSPILHKASTSIGHETLKELEIPVTAISEEPVPLSDENSTSNECPPIDQEEVSEVVAPFKNKSDEKASIDNDDTSPPASEVSCSSKASGNSVKDMVSKFSGFSSLSSSSSGGSALSKGLQAKKEARQAKIAEMRAKSKPVTSSKGTLTSKEYSTTLSSLNATASKATGVKKKNLATQMREKAAALAYKNKTTNSISKPGTAVMGSTTNKRNLPFTNNSNTSNIISAQDYLGTTLKQGAVPDSLGATLKQGVLLKKSKLMSPMDTYEISDREDSDTDDSDSDSENEKQKKKIPTWAMRANLYPALEEQYNGRIGSRKVDPDDIFPEVQSCNLEAIFGTKKAKTYRSRASSGNWAQDKVSAAEKLLYKREMGFATDTEIQEI
mmetsp:Transcript_45738/g.51577  ORF Transcript_45738/g.51577 Transcript_45738/m.51577 type:complete len:662 (-) Transcript_45738:158-2143(-)